MFIEYPKALYMGGVADSYVETPYVVVNSAEEEAAKNAEGWFQIGKAPVAEPVAEAPAEVQEEAPKRRGRPPKAEQ